MMKASVLASIAAVAQSELCCQTCPDGQQKYYSVDMKHGHCGEACIDPSKFGIFHVFESNLTIADGSTGFSSCADLGWPKYTETVTHGDPLKILQVTLDLYDHDVELASKQSIEPVADLDFAAYTGRWYQTYVSLSAPFQIGATCVTADYGVASDGKTVTITNTNRYNGAGLLQVEGFGAPNPDGSGELEVVLGRPGHPVTGIPVWGENKNNYVVASVGPVVDGMYDYAIVSEPAGDVLYVLARDVARFEQQHEEKVLKLTAELGFTEKNNSPHKTKQDGCTYDFLV